MDWSTLRNAILEEDYELIGDVFMENDIKSLAIKYYYHAITELKYDIKFYPEHEAEKRINKIKNKIIRLKGE